MFNMAVEYLEDMQILRYNRINNLQRDNEEQSIITNKVKLQTK
jgi:hypothetical protein